MVRDAAQWVEGRKVPGLTLEVIRQPGRTPVIFFEVAVHAPAAAFGTPPTIVMYGHLDKQPEFSGWRNDLGPWTPKVEDDKLYGRGGADDGYAVYAAVSAIEALEGAGHRAPAHRRPDRELRGIGLVRPAGLPRRAARSAWATSAWSSASIRGAGNYDQLWLTTSLRGNVTGTLKVEILTEGIHSGDASGLVPSSFRILRHVLDRLEDSATGRLLPESFHCQIPTDRVEQVKAAAAILGDEVWKRMPWACGADGGPTLPTTTDPAEALLNRTWRPTLSVTGVDGFPELRNAGNVLRPFSAFKLSLRLPPLVDANEAAAQPEDAARGQRALQRQGHLPAPTAAWAPTAPPAGTRRRSTPWMETRAQRRAARRTSARRWATSARAARSR